MADSPSTGQPSAFEPLTLSWQGRDYVVPARRVLEAIARMEESVPVPLLFEWAATGAPSMARLAKAYGAALRFAGAHVSDDEIYRSMFSGGQADLLGEMLRLMSIMVPVGNAPAPAPEAAGAETAATMAGS